MFASLSRRLRTNLALVLALPLACSAFAADYAAGSQPFAHAAQLVQDWGRYATGNPSLSCSTARGQVGAFAYLNTSTMQWASAAGAGATGPISITAGGVARGGMGTVVLASGTQFNVSTGKISWGRGIASQYLVDSGLTSLPADSASATAAFDACFGSAARLGIPLCQVRYAFRTPILWFGSQTANLPEGRVRITVWLVKISGRVYAVQSAGSGVYESSAQ